MDKKIDSSWEDSHGWYDRLVGKEGHYYHQHLVLPKALKMLSIVKESAGSLLDLACGQGVLSRHLPSSFSYTGIDASPSLIRLAKKQAEGKNRVFLCADLEKPLSLPSSEFTHATVLLAMQNFADPLALLKNAHRHLCKRGKIVLVLNHPCFRIPRQSSWHVDVLKKCQFRRVDRYFSPLKIPIQTHPSQGEHSSSTWSFHFSLSAYSKMLSDAGFFIELIEEWCSDKKSVGKNAVMENRSRQEFPLFLAISAQKN